MPLEAESFYYFQIPGAECRATKLACVVGEFNGWSPTASPMKRLKNGTFSLTLPLERDRRYAFRYLLDGAQWLSDSDADESVPTPYGDSVNSVIVL